MRAPRRLPWCVLSLLLVACHPRVAPTEAAADPMVLSEPVTTVLMPAGAAATPTPGPRPISMASPTPSPVVYVPYAIDLSLTPGQATLSVAPANGATPLRPVSTQLVASVLMSNGARMNQVNWVTTPPDLVTVSAGGTVTAGPNAGKVTVTATSLDGRVQATASIEILAQADALVTIE